jgi:RNA polymerase sigma-70 factor (ECF subfamily)
MSDVERQLIDRVVSGDRDAFEELVRRHERLVAHMVYRMISDRRDREELCQDVFLRVHQRLRQFEGNSTLSTWIARIAYRCCLNHLQKRSPHWVSLVELTEHREDPAALAHPSSAVLDAMTAAELRAFVREAVARLPPAYSAAVTLVYLEEMSIAEVSEILELPQGTVKSHLFRARALLKQWLLEGYAEEELER